MFSSPIEWDLLNYDVKLFSGEVGEKAVTCVKTAESPRPLVWVKHMSY